MELKVTVPKEEKTPKAELHLGHVRMARKKLVDLIPADYNPRVMSQAARAGLEASVESFGLVQPIVLNERTGVVVSGHQRLNALFAKGATETDVVLVDLDPIREKALNVTMNNKHIEGDFDESKLADLLSEIQLSEPDLMGLVQLDTLVIPHFEGMEDPGDVGEPRITMRKIVVEILESHVDMDAVRSTIDLALGEFAGMVRIR